MLASTGSIGARVIRALWLRQRTEKWAREVIRQARQGKIASIPGTALHTIANHRDLNGEPLSIKTAAVELLNVLRAIVAVARFIVFAAKDLHEDPASRARIAAGEETYLGKFVEEVRRTAPFFPMIGGRARETFEWQGHEIEKGDWILLDLYGTNRDPQIWMQPERFDPSRFDTHRPTPFELVPQGAGETAQTHRCPGENMTLELMKVAVNELAAGMSYVVPEQDLSIDKASIPALPASGVILSQVRSAQPNASSGRRRGSRAMVRLDADCETAQQSRRDGFEDQCVRPACGRHFAGGRPSLH
jgi:fatty-acid peroxygenase